ncbi:sugar ABC transporter ATP-binding protein [Paeniglutamicibacter sulfureus]|uniref:Ribose transport system ATP-binding protein n=1 Tax=Paeniglutamicibacter sulfureus TaxID=43666 RepID=A0ABU2BHE0_9MICC|nr:sugar ABC transporter ATP-binding protein [Paeniglutamicibacter sulfureus]MDO2933638.1 sugar ABC transporter ATP-binding protein [Paeniglutamicibacter sulfureus]MDR7358062.1 ribose transport system ATP-binding protein [Paeniglutamicibacter sulfureus]
MSAAPGALGCVDIHKGFAGVPVLKGITLSLEPGTVTALAGENGAGKSTLMKIASGQYRADDGIVEVAGTHLPVGNPQAANQLGVAIVPQELASIPEMTVYENLYIGRELRRGGFLRRRAMRSGARAMLSTFGLEISPDAQMGSLPVGIRQIIEIAKATTRGAKVLLLDEPTSAIAEKEVARLAAVVRQLRADGVALLFTTHKMEEIRAMADRVIVLRDGNLVEDQLIADITDDGIVRAMIGRELEDLFPQVHPHADEVLLEVSGLGVGDRAPVSLSVRRGEILGLAGLVGAGRTELIETIFGMRAPNGGTVTVSGSKVRLANPAASIVSGMALVPEDRKGAGAVMGMSILDNTILPRLSAFSTAGWLHGRSRQQTATEVMDSLRLRRRTLGQPVEKLSGGNQQKVVLGRWLTGKVDVLLLDEPTRGVDVGARNEIYRIITELAQAGMAVVMASSDMPEILSLTHRTMVMRDGAFAAELSREELSAPDIQDRIFRLASGQEADSQKDTPNVND